MAVSISSLRLDENGTAMSTPLPTPNDRLASVKNSYNIIDNDNKVLVCSLADDSGRLLRRSDAVRSLVPTLSREEGGEVPGIGTSKRGNGHSFRLQVLKRPSDIQDGLHSGTHHRHWGPAEFCQVSAHIKSCGVDSMS